VYSSDLFDPRWLSWIGFFVTTPDTADLVPVFPWFGVMLVGMLGMRVLREAPAFGWSSGNRAVRLLALLGRWSLVFYLAHQLILVGIIAPLAGYLQNAEQAKLTSFTQSCQQSCGTTGDVGYCTAYCRCALDLVVRGDLWAAVNASPRSAGQQADVNGMTKLCTAMASDGQ
ncbi:MAG TPA: heparan-alpha-glucosaminide N-acetyltransferase domain-containing protein, partial [Devosia sp.]|nr:heparan-alpha-glucosaminide N-acetyltransferase domain-containing protein [Devosia sp.]